MFSETSSNLNWPSSMNGSIILSELPSMITLSTASPSSSANGIGIHGSLASVSTGVVSDSPSTALTNITAHIEAHLGPQRALPLNWLIPMTAVYILILVFGLIGNLITILVIFRFRYMQTITNLYLCNLAITDLISLLLSLPLELYTLWHQYPWQLGETMCRMKTLILEGTANASVLTLVAFTLERFLAICASSSSNIPPVGQSMLNPNSLTQVKRIATRNIALIWTISLFGAMPLVMLTRINYLKHDNHILQDSAWCGLPFSEPDKKWEMVILASTVIFFLIPLMLISALYYKIAKKLKAATRLNSFSAEQHMYTSAGSSSAYLHHYVYNQHHNTDSIAPNSAVLELPSIVPEPNNYGASRKLMQSRKIVIRMLVVIVIVFTFCWSPFHAQRLLFLYVTLYSSWNLVLRQINGVLFLSAGCLYYLNSSLNPLIYSLLSTRFRAAFVLYVNSLCGKHSSNSSTNGANKSHTGTNNNNHSGNVSNASNSQVCRTKNYPMWPPPPPPSSHSPKPPLISPSNHSLSSAQNANNSNNGYSNVNGHNPQKFHHHSPLIALSKKDDGRWCKAHRNGHLSNGNINKTQYCSNHCSCCNHSTVIAGNNHNNKNSEHLRGRSSSPKVRKMSLFGNSGPNFSQQNHNHSSNGSANGRQHYEYRNCSVSSSRQNVTQNGSKSIFQ